MITVPITVSSPYQRSDSDAAKSPAVPELLATMQEHGKEGPGRSFSSAAALTSLCADISPSSSHFFEVLYVGKIKVSHKKVPDSFIDDALVKFRVHELEKGKMKANKEATSNNPATVSNNNYNSNNINNNNNSSSSGDEVSDGEHRRGSQDSGELSIVSPDQEVCSPLNQTVLGIVPPAHQTVLEIGVTVESLDPRGTSPTSVRANTPTGDPWPRQISLPLEPMRHRASSAGNAQDLKNPEHNRTMLFQVGRTDLRLISPDRKQVLLHKHLRDVASCIQGIKNSEHFGFICREPNVDCYIGYVFKCQSECFADDVVGAITQAFLATSEVQRRDRAPVFSCEHCPMVWYHKLCSEVEGLADRRVQGAILRRVEQLPEDEQALILAKFRGAEFTGGARQENEFLMMLLRAHCEAKQVRHTHDTAENRHEFLNQYLGGSTIFMKAKRSLTSSFDQLLKRKGSRDDLGPMIKEMSLPMNAALCKDTLSQNGCSMASRSSPAPGATLEVPETTSESTRPRSSTVGTSGGETMKRELQAQGTLPGNPQGSLSAGNSQQLLTPPKGTPMMNIFMKVGHTPKTSSPVVEQNSDIAKQSGSWRQAIFNRVVTPNKALTVERAGAIAEKTQLKRSKEELRSLWKKAINQQLLLIRMEKENARLKARQEEATVKRIKLQYDELGGCVREVMEVWDLLVSQDSRVSTRCDSHLLLQAIRQGVPRAKRGEVWLFLADQFCMKQPPPDVMRFPLYHESYERLLRQLTSHQHAILIDLGRTFPGHPYFASPLGPGQLALFNLLKAYSLLDPEVGYCQGLSFVAGVLLLHMSEEQAFLLLRHLMFRRGLRKLYLPDMSALQAALYQLSRLLHDRCPELYAHLDRLDAAPTLYAAPWLLTLFASQFPLGFVTRVFDLLFLESPEVIFRVALALLTEHRDKLLACDNFEEVMDYLKVKIPAVDRTTLDRVMKQVFSMDVSRQLREYEVEYHVLQEEMASPHPEAEILRLLEEEKRVLLQQNRELSVQLHTATLQVAHLESSRASQQMAISSLESQVRGLEVSVATMGHFITSLAEQSDVDIPGEVRRIVSQLAVAERRRGTGRSQDTLTLKPHPLRVIDTKGAPNNEQNSIKTRNDGKPLTKPHPLKTALSSPNLSTKMSAFFANSHNQIKQQKMMQSADSNKADIKQIQNGDQHKNQVDAEKFQGTDQLKNALNQENNNNKTTEVHDQGDFDKSKSIPLCNPRAKLKTSQSSFELGSNLANQIHPLDSSEVTFTYGGTTKLRTLRPLRAQLGRNASTESLLKAVPDADILSQGNHSKAPLLTR